MATLNHSDLIDESDAIKNETEPSANTASRIGQMFEDIIDSASLLIDNFPYKKYSVIVSMTAGPTFSQLEILNDFGTTLFTFTNPSSGLVTVTASDPVFTASKTASPGGAIYDAGTQYFLSGVRLSDTVFNFRIVLHDGTSASTPEFTDILFEIIVGN